MSLAGSDAGRESDSSKETFDDAQEGHSGNLDDALTYIVKEGGNNICYLCKYQMKLYQWYTRMWSK